jgi:hypothetical protein
MDGMGGPFGSILGRPFSSFVGISVFLGGLLVALWSFWWMAGIVEPFSIF